MARLGMTAEKSGRVPSRRSGTKDKLRQIWTERRSKVWPEGTTTGSDMRKPVMGQRNSGGVSSCLCCGTVVAVAEAERWWKENHLCLLFPPIGGGEEKRGFLRLKKKTERRRKKTKRF